MKIAFLHYHLKPGGVSTVIRQQIAALAGRAEMLLLTGTPPDEPVSVPVAVIAGIGYDSAGPSAELPDATPEQTADHILRSIHSHWPQGCDILHVHNPLLAKNARFPAVLSRLQAKGARLLLQVHDFAEDGRPNAYYSRAAYPADCHYCVINARDEAYLLSSGLSEKGLHRLPNMVNPFDISPEKKIDQNFVLYPVRAIRRKNIGEAMLLSLFFAPHTRLAITLPPNSPRDKRPYQDWLAFAEKTRLPVLFEASRCYNFRDLVQSAQSLITTSITEGFGFSFLEPWTAGQFLTGRKLPDICRDFEENGLRLDHLYERLAVPLGAFDEKPFFEKWRACIRTNAGHYGIPMPEETIHEGYRRLTDSGWIDFGLLDETFQQQAIELAAADPELGRAIRDRNPGAAGAPDPEDRNARIADNRETVQRAYNEAAYRRRLLEIYEKTTAVEVSHAIDKTRLALCFLRPETFSLLKWGEYDIH